ncbi:MAG: PQQ-binding-like beta-propeller repeat protein [Verrucomicrobia bacterium]|nr:PQQ-binding-like beta-propeller repeat protein [Verrucomicrobiota bacterium]
MFIKLKCLGIAAAVFATTAFASEWPSWRGSQLDGVSDETNIPTRWSSGTNGTQNIAWKVAIPGSGHSSPIIWGDRVFVTTYVADGDKRILLCLDRRSGKTLWERTVLTSPPEKMNRLNSYASGTPATDGQRVWVAFLQKPNIAIACYDMEGKELWRKSPGTFASKHGFCSSPVLHKDLVILNCDQDDVAWIVAYEKNTGVERWRTDRPNRTRSYCTPIIVEAAGKTQMVLSGSVCVASYDPATGKQHWLMDGPTEQFVASPVFAEGVFFISGGFPERHFVGIRPDGTGNITQTHIAWRHKLDAKMVSYVPSPIVCGPYFFIVSEMGHASCLEAKTGKILWTEKLGRHHWPSPVRAGNLLYFLDDDSNTHVIKAGPKFEQVAVNPLGEEKESCYASPAISRGQLFIRTLTNLYCIGK